MIARGKLFLDCCKTTGTIIVNDRLGQLSANHTTVSDTTVDYMLCTIEILKDILDRKVHDFNRVLSDVHCAIETTLKCTPSFQEQTNTITQFPHVQHTTR